MSDQDETERLIKIIKKLRQVEYYELADAVAGVVLENERLRKDAEALQRFVGWILQQDDGDPYEIDGGDIQCALEVTGILTSRQATEPCGATCACAEFSDFPTECFSYSDLAKQCIATIEKDK
jgi:uncharacterized protein YggL (DUF469 family)